MDPRAIVGAAVDTIAGGIPDDIRADYLDCYDGDRFAESMRYVRTYPEQLPQLAELLPQITTPVTLINGSHDSVVPLANEQFLDERLPTSRLVVLDAGHFLWEEEPAAYAAAVLGAVAGAADPFGRRGRTPGRERTRVEPVVYLLRCGDGSLYCGWTLRLDARLALHRAGRGSKYVASRLPVEVVAVLPMRDRRAAMREEARIKRLTRAQKETLVAAAGCGSPTGTI